MLTYYNKVCGYSEHSEPNYKGRVNVANQLTKIEQAQ